MPQNKGIEGFNARGLLGTPVERPGTILPGLTPGRILHLTPRSVLMMSMPSLARHIQHQLDYLREKGGRLGVQVVNHAATFLTRVLRMPILPRSGPLASSTVWQRVHDFIWIQRGRRNRLLQGKRDKAHITGEQSVVDNIQRWADEAYPDEAFQWVLARKAQPAFPAADNFYPIALKTQLLSRQSDRELHYTGDESLRQARGTLGDPLIMRPADELDVTAMDRSPIRNISLGRPTGMRQASEIRKLRQHYSKATETAQAQTEWQQAHTYQSRWPSHLLSPFIRGLVPRQVPSTRSLNTRWQDISLAYDIPVQYLSCLSPAESIARAKSWMAQQRILFGIPSGPQVTSPTEKIMQTVDDYGQSVNIGNEGNLPHPLHEYIDTGELRTEPSGITQGFPLKTGDRLETEGTRSVKSLIFKSLIAAKKPTLDLLISKDAIQRARETFQAMRPLPLSDLVNKPQIGRRRETDWVANIGQELASMALVQHHVVKMEPDNIRPDEVQEVDQSGISLTNREPEYYPKLHRETWPETQDAEITYRMPSSYFQQRFESFVPGAKPPGRIENYDLPWDQDYESSFNEDTLKHTRQSELERLLTPAVGPWTGPDATDIERVSAATFSAPAYHSSQPPKLELAAAPVQRTTEVSPAESIRKVRAEGGTIEEEEPDIDAIARQVYPILKRRLAIERERLRGLS